MLGRTLEMGINAQLIIYGNILQMAFSDLLCYMYIFALLIIFPKKSHAIFLLMQKQNKIKFKFKEKMRN